MPENPEVNAVLKFGSKRARDGATPKIVIYVFQGVMIIGIVWSLFVQPVFTNLPAELVGKIDKTLLALNATLWAIGRNLGWVIPSNNQTTEV